MTRDYFYCLQSHDRPVNDLSTAVPLTNRLLRFLADGGFVYNKRVSSPSFLVSCQSLIVITTSWFAIALDEIRTRRILREKADCKQSISVASNRSFFRNALTKKIRPFIQSFFRDRSFITSRGRRGGGVQFSKTLDFGGHF